jgi:hypothetical protein
MHVVVISQSWSDDESADGGWFGPGSSWDGEAMFARAWISTYVTRGSESILRLVQDL